MNAFSKKIYGTAILLMLAILGNAQSSNPTLAVIGIDSKVVRNDGTAIDYMVRLEIEKTNLYSLMDKYDMNEAIAKNNFVVQGCYGKSCVVAAGKMLNVDKMVTGSVEQFGSKVVITLKLINVKTEIVEKANTTEFIDVENELQRMIRISIEKLFDLPLDAESIDKLVNYELPIESPKNELHLNGPRMGFSYTTGLTNTILTNAEGKGGFNMYPATFLFGWQQEFQYLSAGNFQAIVEFIPQVGGLESGNFIPSLTLLNGFRMSKRGWEVAFGPSFRWVKKASGFYIGDEWHLEKDRALYAASNAQYLDQNLFPTQSRLDSRGKTVASTSLVIGVGKTFRSGYLNIPLNVYFSPRKDGHVLGASFGFNIYKKRK